MLIITRVNLPREMLREGFAGLIAAKMNFRKFSRKIREVVAKFR